MMKVLFISSGNRFHDGSPIIRNQGDSLIKMGVHVEYLAITGKGIFGYLKNIFKIIKIRNQNDYDIFHSHYSLTSFVVALSGAKPQVISLMGSDINNSLIRLLIKIFNCFFFKTIIVKSIRMKNRLKLSKVEVIPNGVNIKKFKPMNKKNCQKILGWNFKKVNILFGADPKRLVKNFKLLENSLQLIDNKNIELHFLRGIQNADVPIHLNAADIVILTSKSEGSPNIIKEAMACNKKVICTDVGDVKYLLNNCKGGYLCSHDKIDVANKIKLAMKEVSVQTRKKVIEHGLDEKSIGKKILEKYKNIKYAIES